LSSRVTFVADNAYQSNGQLDGAGNFWAFSDAIVNNPLYTWGLTADRVYYNPCNPTTYPQCALPYPTYPTTTTVSSQVVTAINGGRLIVNYIGHSSQQEWSHEGGFFGLFTPNEVSGLANASRYPVMLSMTCLDGYFHNPDPAFSSLAESLVRLPNAGALASWSATGLGVASGHDRLDKGFFRAVTGLGIRQIGAAVMIAKADLKAYSSFNLDLLDTYTLFGDPASRLALPPVPFRVNLPLVVK
jgi:hypothetical protein